MMFPEPFQLVRPVRARAAYWIQVPPPDCAGDSVRNMTSQQPLGRTSDAPCEACVSRQSRPRASADDSVRNMPSQPPLDHPSDAPCEAFVSRQPEG